jgi:hypothetical protein
VNNGHQSLLAGLPIPLRQLEPCIASGGVLRRQKQYWFTRFERPPLLDALCGAGSVDSS